MDLRTIVRSGVVAAFYAVSTVALAPISYGPLQFRVSEALKPLALYSPVYALAFAIGTGLANMLSPFGFWDFALMPLVDGAAALTCYTLRRSPWVALLVQATIISAGVALFPLGLGAGLPFLPTFSAVWVSETVIILTSYAVVWRRYGDAFNSVLGETVG